MVWPQFAFQSAVNSGLTVDCDLYNYPAGTVSNFVSVVLLHIEPTYAYCAQPCFACHRYGRIFKPKLAYCSIFGNCLLAWTDYTSFFVPLIVKLEHKASM